MNKISTLLSVLIAGASSSALAKVDIDALYSCRVVESSNKNLPPGTATKGSISLRSLAKNGLLFFGEAVDAIDLYSPLGFYDAYVANSGYVVLATDPTEDKEVQGSILVTESVTRSLELSVTVQQTTRVFAAATGKMAFVSQTAPAIYKLDCTQQL